jgi:hypothetical protein
MYAFLLKICFSMPRMKALLAFLVATYTALRNANVARNAEWIDAYKRG